MSSPTRQMSRRKSGLLKHQLQLVKKKGDPSGKPRYEVQPIPDTLSFEKGFFLFIRALQLLREHNDGILLVGLAGPSGAGKTVFSEKISNFMPGCAVISMDNYNDASRLVDGNFDDPRLTDYTTLMENIQGLLNGQSVEVPIYDFKQSKRVGFKKVEVPTARVVIIEGIYALSEKLRPMLDLAVSITGGVHFDLVKRVLRDINRSGQEPEDIIHQISETVYPMYKAFIEPDLQTAHIRIVNKFNPFSGFQTATYILKSQKTVTADQIRAVMPPNCTEYVEETYDIYLLPPGEDVESCQSYLRMRNRDGKYSLMFEEWVTDGPFIISPRITFEVSVRILGGLMALGYEMGAILRRSSQVFRDDTVAVKIDTFEQLQREYVNVQGRDRLLVQEIGKKLGLEGTYVPRSYIEQMQLEKLTKEFQLVPEDIKQKLVSEDALVGSVISSPSMSWIAEARLNRDIMGRSAPATAIRNGRSPMSKQYTKTPRHWPPQLHLNSSNGSLENVEEGGGHKRRHSEEESSLKRVPDSPFLVGAPAPGTTQIGEQLQTINEKFDQLLDRMVDLERRIAASTSPSASRGATPPPKQKFEGHGLANGPGGGSRELVGSFQKSYIGMREEAEASGDHPGRERRIVEADGTLSDEVRLLARGQRHISTQLDVLSGAVRDNLREQQRKDSGTQYWRKGHLFTEGLWEPATGVAVVAGSVAVIGALVWAWKFKGRSAQ